MEKRISEKGQGSGHMMMTSSSLGQPKGNGKPAKSTSTTSFAALPQPRGPAKNKLLLSNILNLR
ncbi:hypothetical protein CsatB_023424 [Cannabis sativa]